MMLVNTKKNVDIEKEAEIGKGVEMKTGVITQDQEVKAGQEDREVALDLAVNAILFLTLNKKICPGDSLFKQATIIAILALVIHNT